MLVWKKLASAKWADAWEERLLFIGPERLAINFLSSGRSIRLEAYNLTQKEADLLEHEFGGNVVTQKRDSWIAKTESLLVPMPIRDKLVIVHRKEDIPKIRKKYPARQILLVPASIAFGTGEHATTSSCLRMLADFSARQSQWSHLDIGTGTGILAMAATMLGAKPVTGVDFDPKAVQAAKENAEQNEIKGIQFAKADIDTWKHTKQYDLVTANIFSDVLIRNAEKITGLARPKGTIILSGIMNTHEAETLNAFRALAPNKIRQVKTVRRGKWSTLQFARTDIAPTAIDTRYGVDAA